MGRPKGGKNRKWSAAEKLEIVGRYLASGIGQRKYATREGISRGMLHDWTTKYLAQGAEGLERQKPPGNAFAALHTSKNLSEVERLRLTVAKQEVELSRLKNGYHVKGGGGNKVFVTTSGASIKSSKT